MMMIRRLLKITIKPTALLLANFCLTSVAVAQQPILFATESYSVLSYQKRDGSYAGAGPDQARMIMENVQGPFSIEIMPWARAMALAETQPMSCVFAAARTPEREHRFKWVAPLYTDHDVLVRHAGAAVYPQSLQEARLHTVGTHREDYTEALLKEAGFMRIDLSADFDTTLRKLLSDRIELMPMSQNVYRMLKDAGTPLEEVMVFSEQHLGIACNQDMPDTVIDRMQASLDRLIAEGVQARILQHYGVSTPQ